jgi:hypothetical protein
VKTLRYFPRRLSQALRRGARVAARRRAPPRGSGLSTLLPLLSVATGSDRAATGYEARVASALAALGIPRIPAC